MSKEKIRRRKKVRLEDVARVAEISSGTASMALSGSPRVSASTRRRVMDACRSLAYQAPRTARKQSASSRSLRVGFLCIGNDPSQPVHAGLLHQMALQSHQQGVRLEVASIVPGQQAGDLLDQVTTFARPCDALLLAGDLTTDLFEGLAKVGQSFAALDLPGPAQSRNSKQSDSQPSVHNGVIIIADDRTMAQDVTGRLQRRGHRHIAFVTGSLCPHQSRHRWYEGYCLAHLNPQSPMDMSALNPDMVGVIGHHAQHLPQIVNQWVQSKHQPTAMVVADMAAVEPTLREIKAQGLRIDLKDIVAWGSPELARIYRVDGIAMASINLQLWAQTALRHAMSTADTQLQNGSTIFVPYQTWNLSDEPV